METITNFQSLHPLRILSNRYPQLYLPVKAGMKESNLYKKIIQQGFAYSQEELFFHMSEEDFLKNLKTPVGEVPLLYLKDREDFEHFIQIMVNACEPVDIPKSMGAAVISGIINWNKINAHKEAYESQGYIDWKAEFKRFTSQKANYTEAIIVVSHGGYSGLTHFDTSYTKEDWEKISLDIRIYHEYTHFVCKKLYPGKVNAILDEIVADCMGLICATGEYDPYLGRKFLGVDQGEYKKGQRLENYIKEGDNLAEAVVTVNHSIGILENNIHNFDLIKDNYVELLKFIYSLFNLGNCETQE